RLPLPLLDEGYPDVPTHGHDVHGGVVLDALIAQVDFAAANGHAADLNPVEPRRQGRPDDEKLASWGVGLDAQHGLEQGAPGDGCPGLWAAGDRVADWDAEGAAGEATEQLWHAV